MELVSQSQHALQGNTILELMYVSLVNLVAQRVHTGQVTALHASLHSITTQITVRASA